MKASHWAVTPAALVGFGLATLFVLATSLTALREQRDAFRAGDRSRHTLDVTVELGRLRDALNEAESAQRDYLLTGAESYLEAYERGRTEVPGVLARLRELARTDPELQERLAALAAPLTAKLDELGRAIELRREGDEAAAVAAVQAAAKQPIDGIEALFGAIETEQSQRFGRYMAARDARRERAELLVVVTAGGALVAMALSLVLLARTVRSRRRADEQVLETEERLRTALSDRLADSETRARAVLDTAVNAIVSIDAQGHIETFNQAAERLFGYQAAEVTGRNVKLLMPAPYRDEHDGYLRRYLETREPRIIGIGREVTGLRKDGTTFPMALAVADTMVDGRHVFTGVITDLTREKEADGRERMLLKQALQNERLADVGAVTARIAHDFGNPLAGLQMTAHRMVRLLAQDPVPVDQLGRATEMIVTTTRHLDDLVGEFKEFAREQRLQLRDIALPAFLQEVVETWRQEAEARGSAFEVDLGDTPPAIRADQDKLRRVIDNLVKNALEAVERGPGVVRVAAETHEPERIRILVADSGPGIPTGMDVFALFETTKADGTGLGLPICKQIVLAHGGGIEYARQPAPLRTVFRIELPTYGPTRRL
jgi:two-component system sensor kinase FixL